MFKSPFRNSRFRNSLSVRSLWAVAGPVLVLLLTASPVMAQRGGSSGRDGGGFDRGGSPFGGGFDRGGSQFGGGFDRGGSPFGGGGRGGSPFGGFDQGQGFGGGFQGGGMPQFGGFPGGFDRGGFGGGGFGGGSFGGGSFGGGSFGGGRESSGDGGTDGRSRSSRSRGAEPVEKKPRPRVTVDLPAQYAAQDTDRDGQLGMYEWNRSNLAEFRSLDRNSDGFLTPRELTGNVVTVASPAANASPRVAAR